MSIDDNDSASIEDVFKLKILLKYVCVYFPWEMALGETISHKSGDKINSNESLFVNSNVIVWPRSSVIGPSYAAIYNLAENRIPWNTVCFALNKLVTGSEIAGV